MTDIDFINETEPVIETDYNLASKLLDLRMRTKRLSQLSYELRDIERTFGENHYEIHNSEILIKLYAQIEEKILELAEEIKTSK